MKIGVCFSGQVRTGAWAIPSIKSFIGDLWDDCDFFVHTWDSHYHKNYSNNVITNLNSLVSTNINYTNPDRQVWSPVDTRELNTFLNTYNPKLFLIENYDTIAKSIENHRCQYTSPIPNDRDYFPPAMYYSYYRSVEMLHQYEQQHEFNYDIVVKLRPDIIFPINDGGTMYHIDRADLKKDIEKVLANPSTLYKTSDLYWISTGDTIKKTNAFWEESIKRLDVSLWSYASSVGISVQNSENMEYTLLRNLWKRIPADDYFMIDSFERFFLELPPKIEVVKNPEPDFYQQHLNKLKSYIRAYGIIEELCNETNCTVDQ